MKKPVNKLILKNFIQAGYKKKRDVKNVNGQILDEELSTRRNKVYVDPQTGKATHVIAGTDNLMDWTNNLLIPFGLHHLTNRYKKSENIQKKANQKYGKENVNLITHSQSGNIAENLQKRDLVGGENTTLNPAIIGKHNKNIKVVKSEFDPISLLTKTDKDDEVLTHKTFNPLKEHSTAILGDGLIINSNKYLKNKKGNNSNMKSDLREQDLIDRMAKLSHDIHVHHMSHGGKENIAKAYKLVGEGIKHSISGRGMSGCGRKKTGNDDVDKFNMWFKAIGQKFKPLTKYVYPVLGAASDRAVDYVSNVGKSPMEIAADKAQAVLTGKPQVKPSYRDYVDEPPKRKGRKKQPVYESESDNNEDEYDSEPPKRKSKKPDINRNEIAKHNDVFTKLYKPVVAQPITPGHEIDHYDAPVASYTSSFSNQPSSYERAWHAQYGRGICGGNIFDDIRGGFTRGVDSLEGVYHKAEDTYRDKIDPYMNEEYGTKLGKQIAKGSVDYGIPITTSMIGKLGGTYLGGPFGGVAGGLAGKYAGEEIARQINKNTEVGGYGIKRRGRPKGSGAWDVLGDRVAGNLGLLANAGSNKLVNMMGTDAQYNSGKGTEGTGVKRRGRPKGSGAWDVLGDRVAGNLGLLANAGSNKLVNMMGTDAQYNSGKGTEGTGVKRRGRPKGSGAWDVLGDRVAGNLGLLANAGSNKLVNMMTSAY